MAVKIFGAICVGSVEQELCIYEIRSGKGIRRIDRIAKLLPIGNESIALGRISYASVEALCALLSDFAAIMKSYHVDAYRAYATTALRDAGNREIVVDQVRVRTGVSIEVIYNSEQRYINYKALAANSREFNEIIKTGTLILDTGHGSLQFSIFDKDALISTENIQIGAAKLNAELNRASLTEEKRLDRVREMVDTELLHYKKLYLKGQQLDNLFGIGENVLYQYWRNREPQMLGRALEAEKVLEACERVAKLPLSDIEDRLGTGREYAKLLPIAAIYYQRVIEITGVSHVYFPGVKFCDGIAAEYAEKEKLFKIGHDFESDIISESKNMAKRYRCSTPHSARVEAYALLIFDSIRKISGLRPRHRLLLQIAAILHGCGKFISFRNEDACGYNIIMSTEIIGLSHAERKLIANVVRFNRAEFDYEATTQPILTAKLTAILRMASSLDRGHTDKLTDMKLRVIEKEKELSISTSYNGDLTLERLALNEQADFFEEIYGIRPVFRQKRNLG